MRPEPGETFDSWSKRVAMFEKGRAMQEIAVGRDVEKVMEEMSKRIVDKLMHPVYKFIRDATPTTFDLEASKARYNEIMGKKGLTADHVEEGTG
jgi:glutamyl-tRNA reductase